MDSARRIHWETVQNVKVLLNHHNIWFSEFYPERGNVGFMVELPGYGDVTAYVRKGHYSGDTTMFNVPEYMAPDEWVIVYVDEMNRLEFWRAYIDDDGDFVINLQFLR